MCWNIGHGHGWPAEGSVLDPGFAYKWGDGRGNSKIATATVGKQRSVGWVVSKTVKLPRPKRPSV